MDQFLFLYISGESKVYRSVNKHTGEEVAIKEVILDDEKQKKQLSVEIGFLNSCHHENIVGYRESFLYEEDRLWIVMDFLDFGSLTDLLEFGVIIEEEHAAYIIQKV